MSQSLLNGRLIVKVGDLTEEKVNAIVNAANSSLLGGGGVDGAIHRGGGSAILAECREIRRLEYPDGLPTGKAVITTAGDLPARYVIHTVGPVYGKNSGRDAELLADCYRNSIALALERGLRTIAFPSISTGVYAYPKREAADVAAATVRSQLADNASDLTVSLVFHTASDAGVFLEVSSLTPRL